MSECLDNVVTPTKLFGSSTICGIGAVNSYASPVRIEETFHQLLGLDECWRVSNARYEEAQSRFVVKVEETPHLWPRQSQGVGFPVTCYDHVDAPGRCCSISTPTRLACRVSSMYPIPTGG